ncbi:MAG: SDR family NAD(P)-dependent oxidoreductase, partial [Gammaproteobacteria bacterium]
MIVVTGASRGLGEAICHRFSGKGERVIGLARSVNELEFEGISCDVGDYQSVKSAARQIRKIGEPVDAVIN